MSSATPNRPAPAKPTSPSPRHPRVPRRPTRAVRTATEWVALLADAQRQGRLDAELERLQRIPLLIVDEVGYIPFDPQAANLMFMLVSRRYERASLIVTSNKPFSAWGEIFGDEITAAAMIDRLVHHAEILASKATATASKTATSTDAPHPNEPAAAGHDSSSPYGLASVATRRAPTKPAELQPAPDRQGVSFKRRYGVRFQAALTASAGSPE